MQNIPLYAGTFTRHEPGVCENGHGKGIYVFSFNPNDGTISVKHPTPFDVGLSPAFFCLSNDNKWLVSTNEDQYAKIGTIRVSQVSADGSLALIGQHETVGVGPSHVAIDRTDSHVLITNYRSGGTCDFALESTTGKLTLLSHDQYEGPASKIFPERQNCPHAHGVFFTPDEKLAFVADLGTDRIMQYYFDPKTGLQWNPHSKFVQAPLGCGPRHMEVNPNGKFAYLAAELSSELIVFKIDESTGCLRQVQALSTLPETYKGPRQVADIHVTPDGGHVYVSNRHHDSIAMFKLVDDGAKAEFIHTVPCGGVCPRNFLIDRSGKWMLVANQDTDNIVVFAIEDGILRATGHSAPCPSVVCLKLAYPN